MNGVTMLNRMVRYDSIVYVDSTDHRSRSPLNTIVAVGIYYFMIIALSNWLFIQKPHPFIYRCGFLLYFFLISLKKNYSFVKIKDVGWFMLIFEIVFRCLRYKKFY